MICSVKEEDIWGFFLNFLFLLYKALHGISVFLTFPFLRKKSQGSRLGWWVTQVISLVVVTYGGGRMGQKAKNVGVTNKEDITGARVPVLSLFSVI